MNWFVFLSLALATMHWLPGAQIDPTQAATGEQAPQHKHTNALVDQRSPYLLQHAHNPVHWLPWSEAALKQAKKEDKLIFLSIGYSTCHWCHVMEELVSVKEPP